MQNENRILDDFAKLMNGLAGTVAGMGREAQGAMKERSKEFVGGLDFVSREEFDAVKDMSAKARAEVDALTKRIEKLEGKPAAKAQSAAKAKAAPNAKTAAKRTKAKTATKAAPKRAAPGKAVKKAPAKRAATRKSAVKKKPAAKK